MSCPARLGLRRLPGLHCYDLLAGPDRVAALFEAEPGTYVLTDFLVRSFRRTVLAGLGLDRYPELWPDYFGHYRRVVWLAQSRDPALEAEARGRRGPVRPPAHRDRHRHDPPGTRAGTSPHGLTRTPRPRPGTRPTRRRSLTHTHRPGSRPTPGTSLTRTHRPGHPTHLVQRGRTRTHRPGTRPTRRAAAPAPTAPVPDPPAAQPHLLPHCHRLPHPSQLVWRGCRDQTIGVVLGTPIV